MITTDTMPEQGITFFGPDSSAVLAAFHASGMAAQGYSIAGRILPQSARFVDADGRSNALFGNDILYAGTFLRRPTE